MLKPLLYTIFVICSLSCATKSKAYKPSDAMFVEDGIVFISFDFKKENNTINVSPIETIQSAGNLKIQNEYDKKEESKYLIQLQDEKGRALIDCYIEDPFVEHKDVFSEDGKIEKHEVKFDQKIITLRIQKLSKEISKATIFEFVAPNQHKYITTLNCKS